MLAIGNNREQVTLIRSELFRLLFACHAGAGNGRSLDRRSSGPSRSGGQVNESRKEPSRFNPPRSLSMTSALLSDTSQGCIRAAMRRVSPVVQVGSGFSLTHFLAGAVVPHWIGEEVLAFSFHHPERRSAVLGMMPTYRCLPLLSDAHSGRGISFSVLTVVRQRSHQMTLGLRSATADRSASGLAHPEHRGALF